MGARSKTSGKVVDTWCWERDDGEKVIIELRLVKRQDDSDVRIAGQGRRDTNKPPFPTIGTEFFVEMTDPKLHITGTDCEAIRRAVFDALDKRYAIKWEKYYVVEIRPESPYSGLGAGFCMSYRDIDKGTTFDGKVLKREYAHYSRGHTYDVEPWPGEFRDHKGKVQACIPATPENEKALKEFTKQINKLRETLTKFLSPELIQQTLANFAGLSNLLPSPDVSPKPPKPVKAKVLTDQRK